MKNLMPVIALVAAVGSILATISALPDLLKIVPQPALWLVLGALASVSIAIAQMLLGQPERETLNTRIERLSTSLSDAVKVIEEMESDIKRRRDILKTLKSDHGRYQKLKRLTGPEVEAIAQALEPVVAADSRRSFWKVLLVSFVFFMLGAGVYTWLAWRSGLSIG